MIVFTVTSTSQSCNICALKDCHNTYVIAVQALNVHIVTYFMSRSTVHYIYNITNFYESKTDFKVTTVTWFSQM
jgi:hypothetical protein